MPRNVTLKLLRGLKANMPVLQLAELYFATDEKQFYVGTTSGNQTLLLAVQGIGNGPMGQAVTTKKKGTGGGPNNPTTVVSYAQVILSGATFWIPLFQ